MTSHGALFTKKNRKSENQPIVDGSLELSIEDINELFRRSKTAPDGKVKMELAGWKKQSKAGLVYTSLAAKFPDDPVPAMDRQRYQQAERIGRQMAEEPLPEDDLPF